MRENTLITYQEESTKNIYPEQVRLEDHSTIITPLIQLKRFLKDENANFVSQYQKHAVECAIARTNDIIARMPTGSGKSLIYQLPAYMEKEKRIYTVIFCPLVALIEDQIANINVRHPNMASKISKSHWTGKRDPTPLMFMHYNDYKFGSKYSEYIEYLINTNQLARVVFDEMQTLLLWAPFTHFRQQLPLIRTRPFQLVFLSGSATPLILDDCINLFSLDEPKVFYQEAARPHIKYTITQEPVNQLLPLSNDDEKIIIFLTSKNKIQEIKQYEVLQNIARDRIFEYHGRMTPELKNENQNKWLETKRSVMLATTAFSLGIDYPMVRHVYVYGPAYELDSLVQMWGRCSRDGRPGNCFYIFANHRSPSSNPERRTLSDLEENVQCIRVSLNEIDHGSSCVSINATLCSFCDKRIKRKQQLPDYMIKRVKLEALAGAYPALKRTISEKPNDNDDRLLENARLISEKKNNIFSIASFIISQFPKEGIGYCLICTYLEENETYHSGRECPKLQSRCKRCVSPDHPDECTYRIAFRDESHILCGLPFENIDKFIFHVGAECMTNAVDRIIPFLMYLFYTDQKMIETVADLEFSSAEAFFSWLFEMDYSITHAMELIYAIIKEK